jgi:hypothetical protein
MCHTKDLSFIELFNLSHQISVQNYPLEQILEHKAKLPSKKHLSLLFEDYRKEEIKVY